MSQELERDIDPPEPVRYDMVKIKKWWITIQWDTGTIEEIDPPTDSMISEMEQYLNEIEYEANRDILENQAQKWGEPDGDY